MNKTLRTLAALAIGSVASCAPTGNGIALLNDADFEADVPTGHVSLYTLKAGDLVMQMTNFGGRVVSLWTPDKDGNYADIELGHATADEYINFKSERFLGAAVGPVANRIGKGTFTVDGETYNTPHNNNGNTLHGGLIGIDMVAWTVVEKTDNSITMEYTHPDGQEGFPGNLAMTMKYTLTEDNEFKVEYTATTDKATPVNLSHHSFFNLHGKADTCINDLIMTIKADATTAIDDKLIPTGELAPVAGTAFDFNTPTAIGDRVDSEELANGKGYDNNWVLTRETESEVEFAARVEDPVTGRVLEVYTDQPGLQFYGGNFFNGKSCDKYGDPMIFRGSIALEAQNFPDAINNPSFPESILRPGETYKATTVYKFSVKK